MSNDLTDIGWIALLDEHVLLDDDGNTLMDIDEEKLHQICDNMNKKIGRSKDYTPVVIGHTKEGLPEKLQPEVVGFSVKYKVAQFMATAKKAIFGKIKLYSKKKDEVVHKFPRRSVELWLNKMELDPISFLGATTPARDLGLLQLSEKRGLHYARSISEDKMPQDQSNLIQELVAALDQLDWVQYIKKQMSESQAQGEEQDQQLPEDDQGMGQGGDGGPPQPQPTPEPGSSGSEPQQYASEPSGSNTYVPGGEMQGKGGRRKIAGAREISNTWGIANPPKKMGDLVQMERNQLAGDLVKYQRAYVDTQAEMKQMRVQLQRVRREKDLVQLENEGIMFDMADELDEVSEMSDKDYQKHLNKMRVRYSRSVVSAGFPRVADKPEDLGIRPGQMSRDDMQRVVAFATQNGLTYDAALAQINGESVS